MASDFSIKTAAPKDLHIDILPQAMRRAFLACIKLPLLARFKWYLAGGTALALQVGHRQSVDLDFFTPQKTFHEEEMERELLLTNNWKTTYRERGTIYGLFMGTKMSFIAYPFFVPSKHAIRRGTAIILMPKDIASMKIIAISQRGRKRDFVDLYWYCRNCEPLENVILRAVKQYPDQKNNINHILKSLTYFEDAENDPMPKIFFKASWQEIKKYFREEVPRIFKKLINR